VGGRGRRGGAQAAERLPQRHRALIRRPPASSIAATLALAACALLAGCGTLIRNPVPAEISARAEIAGMPGVRAVRGRISETMERDLALSFTQESRADFPVGADGHVHYAHLAISGGGANGAFGAGFLNGWTQSGTRPTFKIVTGVSTGALMAPFAFIGPDFDDALREFYTTTSTVDILLIPGVLRIAARALSGESLADSGPLAALIARHVDEKLLARVGDAHRNGRRLYIGTVDLDAQRFVVWNMGLIAVSGHPDALQLFRDVMLASASIPVAFPPVFFEVLADGVAYDEMHVDGGVAANVFYNEGLFRPRAIRLRGGTSPPQGREDIFVIHNGQLFAPTQPTRRTVRGIATSVFSTATRSGMVGDLFRIHTVALVAGASFRWVTIPDGISIEGTEFFDPVRMRALYDVGFALAKTRDAWATKPPGLVDD